MNPQERAALEREEAQAARSKDEDEGERAGRLNALVARADVAASGQFAAVRNAILAQRTGLANTLHEVSDVVLLYRAQGGVGALAALLAYFDGAQEELEKETSG